MSLVGSTNSSVVGGLDMSIRNLSCRKARDTDGAHIRWHILVVGVLFCVACSVVLFKTLFAREGATTWAAKRGL